MALNKSEAKALLSVGSRSKFTESTKDEALRWLMANADKGATIGTTAEKFGMSAQTLATYRKAQLIEHGLVDAPEYE